MKKFSGDLQHLVCVIFACGGEWQRFTVALVELNRFIDDITQFRKDCLLIVTVTTTIKQSRTTPDVTLILIGPLNNLDVSGTRFHFFDSSIAALTARSW